MVRFLFDEDADGRILRGLRRRYPEVDVVRVVDLARGATDVEVLDLALRTNRVLVTQDESTMPGHFADRLSISQSVPGVVFIRRSTTIRQAIEE